MINKNNFKNKEIMSRKIKQEFIDELNIGVLRKTLEYVKSDDTLDMELRGKSVSIYYRGGLLFSIEEDSYEFSGMDKGYHKKTNLLPPSIDNIEKYIPEAKHIVDVYVTTEKNHLEEKDIQQQIVRENNYSPNSLGTDFFIIDIEYQDSGRFDIVALRWDSSSEAHKLSKNYKPVITVFEVKQGFDSCSGKSGLYDHLSNFISFSKDTNKVESFKNDMIEVFKQKRKLGLIRGMDEKDKYKEIKIEQVEPEIEFVFLLANYKPASVQAKKEIELIKEELDIDPKFIYANPMGYGLYARNVIDSNDFITRFVCK
jgi:hypothetical protein